MKCWNSAFNAQGCNIISVEVSLTLEFLGKTHLFFIIDFWRQKNHSKFENFCSTGRYVVKWQTCTLPCQKVFLVVPKS